MSQSDFGNLSSPLSGTDFFNNKLEPFRDALHTSHSGASRPAYAVAGMLWLDTTTTPWVLNMFDGTDDISLGTINASTNIYNPSGVVGDWCGSAGGTANALTFTPTQPRTAYTTGDVIEGLITATNTSETVTINVSGLGTKASKACVGVGKVNIPIGAQQAGMIGRWVYDGTDFILLNVRANNPATAVASAGTLNLDTATGDYVEITGTTTVTAVTLANGQERTCRASGSFTLTQGASLLLPGGANIITNVGDVFVLRGEPSSVVRLVSYTRADGSDSAYSRSLKSRLLNGLTLGNNAGDATNDIDIAAGAAISDDGTTLMVLASGITKQLDAAWAVGTAAGFRDTGAISDNWWHLFLIHRPDTGVTDVLASLSLSSPTMPTNYTKKAYIGSINRASGAIRGFTQNGKEFRWKAIVADINVTASTGSRTTHTMTVPPGRKVDGLFQGMILSTSGADVSALVTALDDTDEACNPSNGYHTFSSGVPGTNYSNGCAFTCRTNTSAQIASRANAANTLKIVTRGWVDNNL
jgi:hypothetical protein